MFPAENFVEMHSCLALKKFLDKFRRSRKIPCELSDFSVSLKLVEKLQKIFFVVFDFFLKQRT